jgi:hypothetical protein
MIRFGIASLCTFFVALAALVPIVVAQNATKMAKVEVAPSNAFDGTYSVEVVTERGTCDKDYRWAIAVADGRVASAGGPDASGHISLDGLVTLVFQIYKDYANVSGRISGTLGQGTWSSPTLRCTGYWRAERQ